MTLVDSSRLDRGVDFLSNSDEFGKRRRLDFEKLSRFDERCSHGSDVTVEASSTDFHAESDDLRFDDVQPDRVAFAIEQSDLLVPDIVGEENVPPGLTLVVNYRTQKFSDFVTKDGSDRRVRRISALLSPRCAAAFVLCCRYPSFAANAASSLRRHFSISSSSRLRLLLFLSSPSVPHVGADFSFRLARLVRLRLELDVAMARLCTLGGGFSALGDYDAAAAHRAGRVSVAQLRVAREMGDPIAASKARLWFAAFLAQTGRALDARRLAERELVFADGKVGRTEPRLRRMCEGLLAKIGWVENGAREE